MSSAERCFSNKKPAQGLICHPTAKEAFVFFVIFCRRGPMGVLIKNGEIVTGDSRYVADIWCENETVTRIDRKIDPPAGAEVIDASGKYVFPGFIDPHTHIDLPFMGTFSKDNYETGTKAALVGGTTTIFDMCCPSRTMEPSEGFETWKAQAGGKAACDYSFHMGVTKFDDSRRATPQNRGGGHPVFQNLPRLQGRLRNRR
jgi:dihydroorotase-like cyclic amidohydrolase